MGSLLHNVLAVLLLLAWALSGVHSDKIKIVDAPAIHRYPSLHTGSKHLILRVQPANISGPPHLQQLAGQCFTAKLKRYTYKVCPFHNVTQKEDKISWNSFHGVLGVWREWLIENDTFTGMLFAMGERCGSKDREAKVLFNCSTVTQLHNISETSTCKYSIWMDTPLACFKGPMQVYHVLSSDHLSRWDLLDKEYYSGEITFQGLTKGRRRLFIDAGLLHDPKSDKTSGNQKGKEADVKVKAQDTKKHDTAILNQCMQEKLQLQKELRELQDKIMDVARQNPTLAFKFGFLQNTSLAAAAVNGTAAAGNSTNKHAANKTKQGVSHGNHAQPAVAGGGEDGRREGVHDDTRPMYEQLDVIGDQEEEKQAGGTNRQEQRKTHQNIQETGNADHQFTAQDGMGTNTQQHRRRQGPSQVESDTLNDGIHSRKQGTTASFRKAGQEPVVERVEESMKELLREQQEIERLESRKQEGRPESQREGERQQVRGKQSQESDKNNDQELAVLLEDNAELQDLLKEDNG